MSEKLKIKKVTPMFNRIVTTANRHTEPAYFEGTNIVDSSKQENRLKQYQKVIAVGTGVHNLKVGDLVWLDWSKYRIKYHEKNEYVQNKDEEYDLKERYQVPSIEINDEQCLFLYENDVAYIIEDSELIEETDAENHIVIPEPKIIL